MKVLHIGHLRPQAGWRMDWHSHEFHETVLVIQGGMVVSTGQEEYVIQRGDVLHYKRGLAHHEVSLSDSPVELYWLAWTGENSEIPLLCHDQRGRLETIMSWSVEDFHAHKPSWEALAQAVVAEHRQIARESLEEDPLVVRARQWMNEWLQDPVSLKELAADMQLSESYFIRRYRKLTCVASFET
jgi:AraC-like DNA-binding protein